MGIIYAKTKEEIHYELMQKILVDGQILAKEHGYLLGLVVKGTYGNNWIKWVNRVEIE